MSEEPKVMDNVTFEIEGENVEVTMEDLRTIQKGVRPTASTEDGLMNYSLFSKLRRQIKREEKIRSKGVLVHMSKLSDTAWMNLNMETFKQTGRFPKQVGNTYVKDSEKS